MTKYSIKDDMKKIVQSYSSPFYLDFEKDIKTALSPEELKAQLNLIDTYDDRTDMQKA